MISQREKLIHCIWTIAFLVILIVAILTLKLGGRGDIATLIGVATGLVSLVLGVIAIVYAFVTNGTLSENSARLEGSSKSIQDSVIQVATSVNEIRREIAPLAAQVSDIHSHMLRAAQAGQSTTTSLPRPAEQFAIELIDYFLASSSWLGLLTLYATIERSKANKSFNAYSWTTLVGNISPDYAIGYLVCATSIGMIAYDPTRFLQQGNIWITQVIPPLSNKISQIIATNLNRSGLTPEEISLRATQKSLTDNYIQSS